MRHGEAEAMASSDSLRQLTARGVEQAKQSGAWVRQLMQDHELGAYKIVSSQYARARRTAEIVAECLDFTGHIETSQKITPLDEPEDFMSVLESHSEALEALVVVSHNPLITRSANQFIDGQSTDVGRLSFSLATVALVQSEFVGSGYGELLTIYDPPR